MRGEEMGLILRLGMLFIVAFFAAGIAGLSRTRSSYSDPFAPYTAIMPGQSFDGVSNYPCQLHVSTSNGIEQGFCQFDSTDGIFGRITVVEADHIITRLAFTMQSNHLRLGDLVLRWGKYDRDQSKPLADDATLVNVHWGNRIFAAVITEGKALSNFLPISYLSLENKELPCNSCD